MVWFGGAWQGKEIEAWQGTVRLGRAWQGAVWLGMAWQGEAGRGTFWSGPGVAWPGILILASC